MMTVEIKTMPTRLSDTTRANPRVMFIAKHANWGVPTAPWRICRCGADVDVALWPNGARWVIKPNDSSTSWSVGDAFVSAGVDAAINSIHGSGQDVIVEPFITGSDVEVPVV